VPCVIVSLPDVLRVDVGVEFAPVFGRSWWGGQLAIAARRAYRVPCSLEVWHPSLEGALARPSRTAITTLHESLDADITRDTMPTPHQQLALDLLECSNASTRARRTAHDGLSPVADGAHWGTSGLGRSFVGCRMIEWLVRRITV
jgi:hypothetical protein